MTTWLVHLPPDGTPGEVRFVKDEFTWLAALAPLLWTLWYRIWPAFVGVLLLSAVATAAAALLSPTAVSLTGALFAILFGLEAGHLRSWWLQQSGWQHVGTLEAENVRDAEELWFHGQRPPDDMGYQLAP